MGPMAGVTDLPFRILCKEKGCSLVCTEMVSAKAITYNNKNTFELLKTEGEVSPLAVQIFGSEPDILGEVCERLSESSYDIIDINMGCPVPKIVNNHEGSALMKQPKLVSEILKAMVKYATKPITVKIRKGFDDDHVNAPEIARIAEDAGVSAIAVHGRTRSQYYSGKADWDIIKEVKAAVKIPVIGNGDITSAKTALDMIRYTGCDGIMVGRAAQGNPWIFEEIKYAIQEITKEDLLEGKYEHFSEYSLKKSLPTQDIIEMILRHAKAQIALDGEHMGILKMRKHVSWYTHGIKNSSKLRDLINHAESPEEVEALLREYLL